MKKFKIFIAICMCFCSFAAVNVRHELKAEAASVQRPAIIDIDTENKLIYANMNSLIIQKSGTGTTVYLDVPNGTSVKNLTEYVSGDGVLTDSDKTISELNANAPASGSDLSEWSIVIGGRDVADKMVTPTNIITSITMTGGSLKAIYNGCSSFNATETPRLEGNVNINITGGEIAEIHTAIGYVGENGATASGAEALINITGGTIGTIKRGKNPSSYPNYTTKINVGGNIKITGGIDIEDGSVITGFYAVNLISQLSASANLAFEVNENFASGNEILSSSSNELINGLDLTKISINNRPQNTESWGIYKNDSKVRFGINIPLESVIINGYLKVGETLTLSKTPLEASIKSVTWYTKETLDGTEVVVGTGESLELNDDMGGKYIKVKVIDKNNENNVVEYVTSSPIQMVNTPEVITTNGETAVYANGNNLLIKDDGTGATIYIDLGTIGELDSRDISLKAAGVKNAYNNGSDLSDFVVYAGCSGSNVTGHVNITMLGGKLGKIAVKNNNSDKINGNVVISLFGGNVGLVVPNAQNVEGGEVIVNIKGNMVASVYGKGSTLGADKVVLTGKLTNKTGELVFVYDNALLNGEVCFEYNNAEDFKASQIKFISNLGYEIQNIKLDHISKQLVFDLDRVDEVRMVGAAKVGKTLSIQTQEANLYVHVKWYRGKTNDIKQAKLIETSNDINYTLTKSDEGMYIFAVVYDGYNYSFEVVKQSIVSPQVVPTNKLVLIITTSVLAALLLVCIVWFILWKYLIVPGLFLSPIFEFINRLFYLNKSSGKEK